MGILCVGSVAYDLIELPTKKEGTRLLGGSATYFCAAASMFTRPAIVGVVGDDFRPEDKEFFHECGVDARGLLQKPGQTFRWHGRYHEDLKRRDSILTDLGVFASFDPAVPDELARQEVVFLGNIEPRLQRKVLAQVSNPRLVALDTIDCWLEPPHVDVLKGLLEDVDIFFLNDDEAMKLAGQQGNLVGAAASLLGLGPSMVVVKRGEHGALLMERSGATYLFPAFPLSEVVDPTGAGDSFAGGFLGYLDLASRTDPATLKQAMAVGTVVASFCVQGSGPRHLRRMGIHRIGKRLSEYAEMVGFEVSDILERIENTHDAESL